MSYESSRFIHEIFREVGGYKYLEEIFLKKRNYDEMKNMQFLESAFLALKGFILDKKHATVIQDYDAYRILLRLISESNDVIVITQALICLASILRMDWKNVIFTVRMNGFFHLTHLIWRVSKSRALPPDSFSIALLSDFIKLNDGFQVEDNMRVAILGKTSEIFRMMSVVLGVLNIGPEIIYAEFAGSYILQNDALASYFLETFIGLVEDKIQK